MGIDLFGIAKACAATILIIFTVVLCVNFVGSSIDSRKRRKIALKNIQIESFKKMNEEMEKYQNLLKSLEMMGFSRKGVKRNGSDKMDR